MRTRIRRWGNGLGLRLPAGVAAEARIGAGDMVELSVREGAIVIQRVRAAYSLDELVRQITPRNRHGETDWGGPAGREPW